MKRRVLVLKAGSGASNNLIRSLRAGDPSLAIVGCNDDRFILKKSPAARNYLIPRHEQASYLDALLRVIKRERIDLVIPNSEADVTAISGLRDRLPCRTFLPRRDVIELCQDKFRLAMHLRRKGLPVPRTYEVASVRDVGRLFRRFRRDSVLWCRIRRGSSSAGAIPVKRPEQARSWIRYWEEMCGTPAGSFTLSEYLPGRDYCVQMLWAKGRLVQSKMHERLSYYVAGGGPSGVSSTAGFARTLHQPALFRMCAKAVRALDSQASGVFFLDIKENEDGVPCITEINAGRFANVPTIHDSVARQNMAAGYVRLALGAKVSRRQSRAPRTEYYVLRDLDTEPAVFETRTVLEGVRDARRDYTSRALSIRTDKGRRA